MQLEYYKKQYLWSFIQLIDECFWLEAKNQQAYIVWKFFTDISSGNSTKNRTVIALSGDNIVGQYTNKAYSFSLWNETVAWYLCQDMCVAKTHRRQGLITKMSKKLYSDISEKTLSIWFSNAQWVKIDTKSKNYWYNVIGNLCSVILPALYFWKTFDTELITDKKILETIDFSVFNRTDDYYQINKTKEYLIWRYFLKPEGKYVFYLFKKSEKIIWYTVYKIIKNKLYVCDSAFVKNINSEYIVNTHKKIALKQSCYSLTFITIYNDYWRDFLKNRFKIIKNQDLYFTLKQHNQYKKTWLLNKEKWIIQWGDIL